MAKKSKKLWQVIDEALAKASAKGYSVTKVFGAVSTFQKLKGIDNKKTSLDETIDALNVYLKEHNLVCFVTRKGVYFAHLDKYTPAQSVQQIEL